MFTLIFTTKLFPVNGLLAGEVSCGLWPWLNSAGFAASIMGVFAPGVTIGSSSGIGLYVPPMEPCTSGKRGNLMIGFQAFQGRCGNTGGVLFRVLIVTHSDLISIQQAVALPRICPI